MKIRTMSDLHLEWYGLYSAMWKPEPLAVDMTILAGDIFSFHHYSPDWLANLLEYSDVIYIKGNHEAYGNLLSCPIYFDTCKKAQELADIQGYKHKIYYGDNFVVNKNDVKFICSTMWTDFNNEDFVIMKTAQHGMNDYEEIKFNDNGKKLKPFHIVEEYKKNIAFLNAQIFDDSWKGKKCVVTHHSPCPLSTHEKFKTDPLNHCYYKNLQYQLEGVNTWVHGHMHNSSDYSICEGTDFGRVICNPRGYDKYLNPDFDQFKTFEL